MQGGAESRHGGAGNKNAYWALKEAGARMGLEGLSGQVCIVPGRFQEPTGWGSIYGLLTHFSFILQRVSLSTLYLLPHSLFRNPVHLSSSSNRSLSSLS
jgi:hypothetical protein